MGAPKGNQFAKGKGRPTEYVEEFNDIAYKQCLLGATDKDLADLFQVSEQTINTWKLKHEKFSLSLKKGKEIADGEVANALYQRACGYYHDDVHIANYQGETIITKITKQYPPDTAAAFIWLKNRQPEIWRDKQEIEHSGEKNIVVFSDKVQEKLKNAGDDL